jgi:hypothetical protein
MQSGLIVLGLVIGLQAAATAAPGEWCCAADSSCGNRCSPMPRPRRILSPEEFRAASARPAPVWASVPTVRELGDHWLSIQTGLAAPPDSLILWVDVTAQGRRVFEGRAEMIEPDGSAETCWSQGTARPPYMVTLRLQDTMTGKASPEIVLGPVGLPVAPPPPAAEVWLTRYLLFAALPFTLGYAATALFLRRRRRRSLLQSMF